MNRHWRIIHNVFCRLLATPLATLLTLSVMGITLSLPVGLYVLLSNLEQAAGHLGTDPQVTVFMKLDSGKNERKQLETLFSKNPEIAKVRFVSREEALKDMALSSGIADLTAGLEANPLPDAFILTPNVHDAEVLERLRDAAAQYPGVAAAELDSNWARRLNALLDLGKQLVLLVAILLGFGLVAGTSNTIRLQLLTRLDEIEVSKLIGATDRFIELPFLYHGIIQGLLGGGIAWGVIVSSLFILNHQVSVLAGLYGSTFQLQFPGAGETFALLGLSALLGWLGAWLAVRRFLRHFNARN